MKILSSIFALFSVATALHAGVAPYLQYSEYYTQTAAGVTLAWKIPVFAGVSTWPDWPGQPEDSANSAAAFRPDGTAMTLFSSYSGPWGWSLNWNDLYDSPSQVQFGTYVFIYSGGTRDGTTSSLTLDPQHIPPHVPQLTDHSFEALTAGDISKPIRLVFRPWMLENMETNLDNFLTTKPLVGWTGLSIVSQTGDLAFVVSWTDPRTASVVVPANSLKPATTYHFSLRYSVQQSPEGHIHYERALDFSFTTPAVVQ